MEIILVNIESKIPKKGTLHSAGYDLYTVESGIIEPFTKHCINSGIKLNIPTGYYGQIAPRSGLAYRHNIQTMAGIIDSDYEGILKIMLYNADKKKSFKYEKGDRIAQIIFHKHYDFNFNTVNLFTTTTNTRGDNGFGSTGIN
jgi:dUTP pyrophosphatase